MDDHISTSCGNNEGTSFILCLIELLNTTELQNTSSMSQTLLFAQHNATHNATHRGLMIKQGLSIFITGQIPYICN
jgi:hypothetical protein